MNNNNKKERKIPKKIMKQKIDWKTDLFTSCSQESFEKKICCSLTCLLSNDDGKIRFYDSDNGNEMKKRRKFSTIKSDTFTHSQFTHTFFFCSGIPEKNQYL